MIVKLLLSLIFAIFGGMGLAISLDEDSTSEKLLFFIGGLVSVHPPNTSHPFHHITTILSIRYLATTSKLTPNLHQLTPHLTPI